jgi:hypothetical protein
MAVVYDEGLLIKEQQLRIDVEGTRSLLQQNQAEAFALAMGVAFPVPETIKTLLSTAHQQAASLAVAAGVVTKDTVADFIRKANAEMESLNKAIEKAKPKA